MSATLTSAPASMICFTLSTLPVTAARCNSLDVVFFIVTVSKYNGPIPDPLNGLHQLASGLAFVHDQQHVHRDICPANILIAVGGDRLIIFDFGLCKMAHDTGSYSVSNQYGQEKQRAPERIENKYDSNYRVTIDSDTWAMGCLFYFFITKGCHPFEDKDQFEMLKKIKDGKFNLDSKS